MNQRKTDKFFNLPDFWKLITMVVTVALTTGGVSILGGSNLEEKVIRLEGTVKNYIESKVKIEQAQAEKLKIQLEFINDQLKEIKEDLKSK